MNPLCIYHKNCADGFAAAWVVNKFFKLGVDLHAADYNTEPPDVTGRNVIIVDFSYKRPVIEKIIEQCESLLIIDHHKTAIDELSFLQPARETVIDYYCGPSIKAQVLFDTDKSGCMLAWRFFFSHTECPRLLKHIQDRDLWKFEIDGTKEVMAALFSYPYDLDIWNKLMSLDVSDLYYEGITLLRKQAKDVAQAVEQTKRVMRIGGMNVFVANVPKSMASEACQLMLTEYTPFAASYFDKTDGREFSLRSRITCIDVAKIAESYGGGGHKHAAGFTLPYIRIHEFDVDPVDWR